MNQSAYQELLQFKEIKPRQREGHERKTHHRTDQEKGNVAGAQAYSSPNVKQDKKEQFQILVSFIILCLFPNDSFLRGPAWLSGKVFDL